VLHHRLPGRRVRVFGGAGAFLAGSLVSESGLGEEIEHLIMPIRDMFLAIFFVSVGC
jgi:Kef-type K+ transport system membrane component KefB